LPVNYKRRVTVKPAIYDDVAITSKGNTWLSENVFRSICVRRGHSPLLFSVASPLQIRYDICRLRCEVGGPALVPTDSHTAGDRMHALADFSWLLRAGRSTLPSRQR